MHGTVLAGRYRVAEVLGRGGMGTVYRATDLRTGGAVAVKVLHGGLADTAESTDRLRTEAMLAASITSPRIVHVTDLDEHSGMAFVVMEYVPGPTLQDTLRERGRLTVVEAVALGLEVAHALAAAHGVGIVHRDLTPQNIKLIDGHVKVLDFGIARALATSGPIGQRAFTGTPEYAAPEQADGVYDARSDLYALGVILYEVVAGRRPFRGTTPRAVLRAHAIAPLPRFNRAVPRAVQRVITRCLARDPASRYQTAQALIADLQRVLHTTLASTPPSEDPALGTLDLPVQPVSNDNLLVGTVTFLFTDIEGSTRLWELHPDAAMQAMTRHDELIEGLVAQFDGRVVRPRGEGDSRFAVFARPSDAVAAASAIQLNLTREEWATPEPLRVRIALHTGEAEFRAGDYYGVAVNRCARLRGVAHGGQILVSSVTADLVRYNLPDHLSFADLGIHRLEDLEQPEHIWQLVHPGLQSAFPALRASNTIHHNLPAELNSFVGRDGERAQVAALLRTHRLVTLVGPGGSGKTRLAVRVAADMVDDYVDGVWLVDLAEVAEPLLVGQAVALVLAVREKPDLPLVRALCEALRLKRMLLVLDNAEHLVAACAELAEVLLQRCPQVRILATSREVLDIVGETPWSVPPLTTPEPRRHETIEQLAHYDAVRLFVDRAVVARPAFVLTGENAAAVAQICWQLDGLPLAIELAAARVKVLTAEQIASRLDDRFHLLTGGTRTAAARHQTLRGLVDWSYDLLSGREQIVFNRLSAFAGGCTLNAANWVCSSEGIGESDLLGAVTGLVDKSLVVMDEQAAQARYRLLETIRQYGRERLADSGQEGAVRSQHASYFLRLAEEAAPHLDDMGGEQARWLAELERENENLRAALRWLVDRGHADTALRLGAALWSFWLNRGYLSEGQAWLEATLALSSEDAQSTVRRTVLLGAARIASARGDYAQAEVHSAACLVLCRNVGDRQGVASSLKTLGLAEIDRGDLTAGLIRFEEVLATQRELEDEHGVCAALNNLAWALRLAGDFGRAVLLLEEALVMDHRWGNDPDTAIVLQNLAMAVLGTGQPDRALELLTESLSILWRAGNKFRTTECLEARAAVAAAQGMPEQAARLLGAAEASREVIGAPLRPLDGLAHDQVVVSTRGVLGEEHYASYWAAGRVMSYDEAVAFALEPEKQLPGVVPTTY